ncbi:selenoneine biosynthesis selenosugar synthase SenB [Pseudoduganella sp. OTU4001]|uniref:selenoneine biosynthesis selenosugar synthase SenB n=1 Tax=Pseudoduganella sp. OTU4001 TaxID=3043854 RepID=UPI00313E351A
MSKQTICIVSPALAQANNGNWQTARRWAQFLRTRHNATIATDWPGQPASEALPAAPDLLIALHARRSAAPLARFRAAHPARPAVLVLTGTDLYRDIHSDASAQASLEHASALVLLQPAGLAELPPHLRAKARVIYQSAPALQPAARPAAPRHHDILMVGHLREEKDPRTFMAAASLVHAASARLLHIGGALDQALGDAANATAAAAPNRYQWLGALPHAETRQRLKHAHAMAICSRMEGGANVIIEAVTSGVPVLTSDISGNRGMLGDGYLGYFPPGDAAALAALIDRSIRDPAWYAVLRQQCAERARLFTPEAEQAALLDLVDNLLHTNK